MPPSVPRPARGAVIRGHLDEILTRPAPASHSDRLDPYYSRSEAAERLQLQRIRILQATFPPDAIAAAYIGWVDDWLRLRRRATVPLRSWAEAASPADPAGWERDHHGFLCAACRERPWQLCSVSDDKERLCTRCARHELGRPPGGLWQPSLPPSHQHLQYPGRAPGAPPFNLIKAGAHGEADDRWYAAGDSSIFLEPAGEPWKGLIVDARPVTGRGAAGPRMELWARTTQKHFQFEVMAVFDYDPTPQDSPEDPYGFRLVTGTLAAAGRVAAYSDVVDLLNVIAAGETCFPILSMP